MIVVVHIKDHDSVLKGLHYCRLVSKQSSLIEESSQRNEQWESEGDDNYHRGTMWLWWQREGFTDWCMILKYCT